MKHPILLSHLPPLSRVHPSLLHSACVPSEEEKVSVNKVIADSRTALTAIDNEISRLKHSLAVLESHRADVEDHIATYQAVLSPIRHLPPEILSEIFLYAAAESTMSWPRPVYDDSDVPISRDPNEVPWRLGAVCSYWRTTLLSLPKVWSTIHLDLDPEFLPRDVPIIALAHQVQRFIDTCLVRAGTGLISFTLRYASEASKSAEENHQARELTCLALTALVEVSERWEDVKLELEHLFSFHALLSPACGRVPNLHTLHLASSGQSSTTPRPWHAIDAFLDAPRLINLTLIRISHPTRHLRLPWGQLRSLRSKRSNFHEGEFTRLLREASSLEDYMTEDERVLDMAVTVSPTTTTTTSTINLPAHSAVHLPHLHTLSIVNKGSYISRIFQLITAPSLTRLSIHSRTAYSAEHTISMLRRSSCSLQLRSLALESSRDLEVAWEENYGIVCLLAETRGVEECVLRVSKAADELVPRLTVRRGMHMVSSVNRSSGSGHHRLPTVLAAIGSAGFGGNLLQGTALLPNLRSFSLEDSFCDSAGELKEMLQSRMMLPVSRDGAGVRVGGESVGAAGVALLSKVSLKLSRPALPTYSELDSVKDLAKEKGVGINILL